ncbi:DUF6522 family protein [Pseudorhodobacter sp.]|uniref:DUF6522 family protein n=1 Tax=Pseudorhodobacter sp. TaxID=1934400 RepID=UPI0026494B83|nr:DUF6522 family protein [Pseudorhodobacter sp.]MDN5785614.1 DUF6522 family protein [Pseudorhodobacter sp.]
MPAVEFNEGSFVVDAEVLAKAFGLSAAEVPELMRNGAITSRCEAGVDADEGRWRLTFYHAARAHRLTVDEKGNILRQSSFDRLQKPVKP